MKEIKMTPFASSQIESIGYDEDLNELFVEFKKGRVYRYTDVPKALYQEFLEADSVGSFFSKRIKGEFEYELLDVFVDDRLCITV